MAKKNSFQTTVECVRMNCGEQSLCQQKSITHGRANHQECTDLPCGGTGKRDNEDPHSIEQREFSHFKNLIRCHIKEPTQRHSPVQAQQRLQGLSPPDVSPPDDSPLNVKVHVHGVFENYGKKN